MIINELKTMKGYRYVLVDPNNGNIWCSLYIINIDNNTVNLRKLLTKKPFRNKGYAFILLDFVTSLYADYTIILNACPYGDHVNTQNFESLRTNLKKLYAKVGFISKPGTKSVMIKKSINETTLF